MPLIDRTFDGGIMGRAGERCHCGLRVRQGEVDRGGAEARREPQGDGQDVSARPSGSLATFTSRTILPVSSTMQTLVSLTETSSPAKWSMLRFSFDALGRTNGPRFTISRKFCTQNLSLSTSCRPITHLCAISDIARLV